MLDQEFNTWQRDYTSKIRRWVPHYDELVAAMTSWPGAEPPRRILDLGCGNGHAVSTLFIQYPDAEYTLVDASADMLQACRQVFRGRENISYRQAYFQDLSFPASTFDLVIAGLAFHHLQGEEKRVIFQKVYHWLDSDAYLLASDLYASKNWSDYEERVMEPWAAYAKNAGTPAEEWKAMLVHHAQFDFPDSFEEQIQWLREAGFSQLEITCRRGYWGTLRAKK